MNAKPIAVAVSMACAGCAPYTQVKMDLVEQSRRGLARVEQSMSRRQELIEQLNQSQRFQLDQAFDADARSQTSFTSDWVIAARKAYAVGIDALHRQADAAERAHESAGQNLLAVDEALRQLQSLHQIERKLSFPEIHP